MITIDFETEAIAGNVSKFPPKPVGVALKRAGQPAKYMAWGHPTGNSCTYADARNILAEACSGRWGNLLFHNAKFDLSIIQEHFFEYDPDPLAIEDTQYLLFLKDPHSTNLSLKPSAEKYLAMPPEEQDDLKAWILSHVAEAKPSDWGAYISKAPGGIVGRYAVGDVDRTEALYNHLFSTKQDMLAAYQREQRLLPVLMKAERNGVRVDEYRLAEDSVKYEAALVEVENQMRKMLDAPDLDFDTDNDLANAVEKAGMAGSWVLTPTGRRSTAKGALEQGITSTPLRKLLAYRGALATCLGTFIRPWSRMAAECNGRMHPNWNQVRLPRGDKGKTSGTRTGRVSCDSPNFTNVPNEFDQHIPAGLPPLPLMKEYLLPEEGHVWLKRDYSQQELRILAHYAEGFMLEQYQKDPTTDFHDLAGALIKENTGIELPRKYVKITAFSIIYGAGAGTMADRMGTPLEEASRVKRAYLDTFPSIETLQAELKYRGRHGLSMKTWGGRDYYCEPPAISKKHGRMMSFEYKMLNYLIQGSAADCTKEALIEYDAHCDTGTFLTTVYDEINISAPAEYAEKEMRILEECMRAPKFDVPMLSEGYRGPNWGTLEDYV